jgi:hypothetical protein
MGTRFILVRVSSNGGLLRGEQLNLRFHDRWEFCDLPVHSREAKEETRNTVNLYHVKTV